MSTDYPSWWEIHRRRIIKWGIVLFLLVAFVLAFMPWLIAPWSRINNEEHEIDLYTGQARITWYILYFQVGREVKETPLSEAIGANENPPQQRQWVKVNIFQPFMRRSPHFRHHGAFGMARHLEAFWEMGDFTPEARAKSARQLLRLWREGGTSADRPYTQYIWDLAEQAERRRKSVRADDIPDDLVDKILIGLKEKAATAPTSRPKTPADED